MKLKFKPTLLLVSTVLVALGLAGCSAPTETAPAASGSSGTSDTVVTAAKAELVKYQAGLSVSPPTSGPAAQKGKFVVIIPCGMAAPGCGVPGQAMADAAAALGWKSQIIDGKLNPTGYQDAMRQAIAAHPDGIITDALSCVDIKVQLQAAKDAKIPVIAGPSSFDCDATDSGPNLYTSVIKSGGDMIPFHKALGEMRANYIIAKTDGKAKIILTTHSDFISTTLEQDAFKKVLATCSGCEIVATVNFAAGDLGTPALIQQKTATVLQQHPEATVFVSSSDTVLGMIGQTLKQNNNPKLIVVASEGYGNTLDLMRQGFSTAAGAFSQEWGAWAAADSLNRIFADGVSATIPDSGMNMQMVDKDHGLDPTMGTGYVPTIDYKSVYKKVWAGN